MRIINTQKNIALEHPQETKDDSSIKIAEALRDQSEINLIALEISNELMRKFSTGFENLKNVKESPAIEKTISITAERFDNFGAFIGTTNYNIIIK